MFAPSKPYLAPRVAPTPKQVGSVAMGAHGMVATAHPLSALTGLNVLQRGGNAVDAAIAIAASEGVLLPMMCGIGGDAFALYYDARRGEYTGANGSGTAPLAATRDYFVSRGHQTMPADGPLSLTVPGAVHLYWNLWQRFGSLEWADLWAPAIRYAEEGVPATEMVSGRISVEREKLSRFPTSARVYLANGLPPQPGERLVQADLARSLRLVAQGGADAYYQGEIAERIAAFCRANGGLLGQEEFARHSTDFYRPLSTTYRGYEIHETAPPSQGFLVLEALNLVEGYDLAGMGFLSADAIHVMVEAKKLAFADRLRHFGDPRFHANPLDALLSKAQAAQRRQHIDPARALDTVAGTEPERLLGDTTYFAVVDRDGNAISFIHTIFSPFGSGVVAGDTGIVLTNRGASFSLEEGHPNVLEPGKRPMHTLNCYLISQQGRPWVVGGTPGADQQPQWNLQVITDLIDFGLNIQQAVEAPRWHSFPGTDPATLNRPFELRLEDRIPEEVRRDLAARGHRVQALGPWDDGGRVQVIMLDHQRGSLLGASDPRSGGLAVGY